MVRATARHILVKTEQACLDLKKQIEGGADFAALAKSHSQCPSGQRGGDLGTFGRGEMVPEFERAAFGAPVGKVVGPVRTAFGWHLILVEEHVADAAPDPAKASEALRQKLHEKETEVQFQQYIEELKREAFIERRP